jgi:hypothetical protein
MGNKTNGKEFLNKMIILEKTEELASVAEAPLQFESGNINYDVIIHKILKKTQGEDCDITPITET